LVKEANRAFETADHLAYVTYPVINDNKLTISIAENLFQALTKGMDAILYYDRLYKRIMFLPQEFNSKLELFKQSSAKRYNISRETIQLLKDFSEISSARKESPIEFSRKEKFVICSTNYKLRTLTIQKMKDAINQTKPFISTLNSIYNQNVRRFRN